MMKAGSPIIRSYTDVHSWVGILCGLFLFTAFYAGAITMFKAPLQSWIAPKAEIAPPPALQDTPDLLDKLFLAHPEARGAFSVYVHTDASHPARVSWQAEPMPGVAAQPSRGAGKGRGHGRGPGQGRGPGGHGGGQGGGQGGTHSHGAHGSSYDPVSLASLQDGKLVTAQQTPDKTIDFVDLLHQQAGVPIGSHRVAMFLTGIICLLYAMALVSGIIIYLPHFIRDVFAVRIGGNAKLMWKDLHAVFGMFSLPFHIIMALTSLIFAFHGIIYNLQDRMLYQGELQHIWRGPMGHPPGFQATLLPPGTIVARVQQNTPGFSVERLDYRAAPGRHMTLQVWGRDPRYGARGPEYGFARVDPYNGDILSADYLPGHQNGWYATLSGFFTLHFGSFGGTPIRWGYVFLGLIGAFMFYTGNHLWILSKEKKTGETRTTRNMARLTYGWMLGTTGSISLIIVLKKVLSMLQIPESYPPCAVFYTLFFAALIWVFCRDTVRARRDMIWFASVSTALVPVTALISCF